MSIMNPKVQQVFANDSQQMKFIAAGIEQLLGAEKTEALISEILPQEIKPSPKFKGQPLVLFNGLSRDQLKKLHGFSEEDVNEVFKLMNVTEAETKSDATVAREAVENAGTASERDDVKTTGAVEEGTSEAAVDAARGQADKSATKHTQAQAKSGPSKGK